MIVNIIVEVCASVAICILIAVNRQLNNRLSEMEITVGLQYKSIRDLERKVKQLSPNSPISDAIKKGEKEFLKGLHMVEKAIEDDLYNKTDLDS